MDVKATGAGAYLAAESSATGGYLTPTANSLEGKAYRDLLNRLVIGLTGLPGNLVRTRWQPNAPKAPSLDTNWCAFGVTGTTRDASSVMLDGGMQRGTRDEVMFSFYGPDAEHLAGVMTDGLQLSQNRDQLRAAGIGFQEAGDIRRAPELVNDVWLERWDLLVLLNREIQRNYSILTLLSASGAIKANGPDPAITIEFQEPQ